MKLSWFLLVFLSFYGLALHAAEAKGDKKVVYKYKKFQKFDFEDLVIEGETGSPGDLSIVPRYQRQFKNNLPYKKNFNAEIRKAIERVR